LSTEKSSDLNQVYTFMIFQDVRHSNVFNMTIGMSMFTLFIKFHANSLTNTIGMKSLI